MGQTGHGQLGRKNKVGTCNVTNEAELWLININTDLIEYTPNKL